MRIMVKNVVCVMALAMIGFGALAQNGWNWPEDKATAEEKNALYSDAITLKQYENAINPHDWLLENAPDLNKSIYIKGVKLYDELQETAEDPAKKKEYQEKVMELYEKRIEYFGEEAYVRNRQAYDAYKYFKGDRSKYPYLFDLYQKTFELNGSDVSSNNIVAYMDVTYRHKKTGGDVSDDQVLEIYDQLNATIEKKIEEGDDANRLGKYGDIVGQLLTQMVTVDCDFIENKLGTKLMEDPENVKLAKKIVGLSLQVKCTDSEAFLNAAKIVQANEPDFGVAKIIAVKYVDTEDYDNAEKYFREAADLAKTPSDKSEVYMSIARMYGKRGQRSTARQMAMEALDADSSNKDAYEFIGDLYFGSFSVCKQGQSKVDDRAIYLAAYDMYEKAGNSQKMAAARSQFPSIEEIFEQNLDEGSTITVGCWINRSTVLRRRPE